MFLQVIAALVFVDGQFSYNETVTYSASGSPVSFPQSGRSSAFNTLVGGYIGVRAGYDFDPQWRVFGSANLLGVTGLDQAAGQRKVSADFNGSFLLSIGVSYAY